jgi:broad specificity phosphatase PhoE
MRTLVHLRHGEREPGGSHVTERGARRAAEAGRRLARFDRVVTSPKPRAVETAEAMGYAADAELPALGGLPGPLERWIDRALPRTFSAFVTFVAEVGEARDEASALAGVLAEQLDLLPESGRLLAISHGGVIELSAVGAVGSAAADWGPTPGYLEGVTLFRDAGAWHPGGPVREIR